MHENALSIRIYFFDIYSNFWHPTDTFLSLKLLNRILIIMLPAQETNKWDEYLTVGLSPFLMAKKKSSKSTLVARNKYRDIVQLRLSEMF